MRQILTNATPKAKIFYLFLMPLAGFVVLALVLGPISAIFPEADKSLWYIHSATVLQAILVFLLPAYLVISHTTSDPANYLKMREKHKWPQKLVFGLLMFVFSYAFVAFLNQWNKGISFPDWMQPIEQWMRAMEDSALETTDVLLSGKTIPKLIANLLVVAGVAAFAEEVFFRGALQQFIKEWLKNGHVAVWLSALVFSAIHFQFYGFFPRLALGAMLGYIFLYTRNLWIAIFVHFINNALVIIAMFFWGETDWMEQMNEAAITPQFLLTALISLAATVMLLRSYKLRTLKNLSK